MSNYNNYIEIQSSDNLIPFFSDIKNPPKSAGEGVWILMMIGIPTVVSLAGWGFKELISARVAAIKAEAENKVAEDKLELAQRDGLIKHLQEQNNMLVNEIMILRRTMDFSGDFTPKDKQVRR